MREIVVPRGESPKRLVNFLKKQFPIGYLRKLFRQNGARVNGRRAKADDPIRAGDRIELFIPFRSPGGPPALSPAPIEIIYEDQSLLVVNKPAGIAVHEGKSVHQLKSLAGIVEKHYRGSQFPPQLVHRLDKDTSGLLLFAKDEKALSELEKLFAAGSIDKEYLCLVVGRLLSDEGQIAFRLPGRANHLVHALTRYRVVRRFADTTLVRVAIETGRLHQIRLHFAKLGYPVVMDDQHGNFEFNKRFRKTYGLKRQFLHAHKLSLVYAGKRYGWTAPLARDLARTLEQLENSTP